MSFSQEWVSSLLRLRPGVAAGEFYIEPGLSRKILERQKTPGIAGRARMPEGSELLVEAARLLGFDFLAVSIPGQTVCWKGPVGALEARLLDEAGFYVFCLVPGGFTRLSWEWGLGETISLCMNRPEEAAFTIRALGDATLDDAKECLDSGCRGVILAEDFAYSEGLYLRYPLLKDVLFPEFEHLVSSLKAPVVLHCDGDASAVLQDLPGLGFAGFHSAEPVGKMSLEECIRITRGKICIMGGFDHRLMSDPQRAGEQASSLLKAAEGTPYMFGSSSGVLDELLDATAVLSAFSAVRDYRQKISHCCLE